MVMVNRYCNHKLGNHTLVMLIFTNHINILVSFVCAFACLLCVHVSSLCVYACVCSVDRALEFTRVSGGSADVLSPSYDLPYSYMAGVAEK